MGRRQIATQLILDYLNDGSFGYYLSKLKESGTDILLISVCEFYQSGEIRDELLNRLKKYIAMFRSEGYEPIIWTNSLGYGGDRDGYFKKRFKNSCRLTSWTGRTEDAVCPFDADYSDVMAQNVRDFIKAGARTILWDDDLLQSFRPGAFCCCGEHLGRLNKMLDSEYGPADVPSFFSGKASRERSAFSDVMGEGLYSFCRKMRRAADETDETVNMGLCASFTHYDCEGVDVNRLINILKGKNSKPLFRLSGAPYWQFLARRFPGQSLPDIIEFVRMQYSWYKDRGCTLMDENDPYPRDPKQIPPYATELYDKATLTMPGLIRHKYFLCYKHDLPLDGYLVSHIGNLKRDDALTEIFGGAEPAGVCIFEAEHKIKEADFGGQYPGDGKYMADFSQPLAGIFFSRFGFSTRYSDSGITAVFGENIRHVPAAELSKGLLIDSYAAKILEKEGTDTGLEENKNAVFSFTYENSSGQKFAVLNFSIYGVSFDPENEKYGGLFNGEHQKELLKMLKFLKKDKDVPYIPYTPGLDIIASMGGEGDSVSVLLLNCGGEAKKNIEIKNAEGSVIVRSEGSWLFSDNKIVCKELPAYDFSAVRIKSAE